MSVQTVKRFLMFLDDGLEVCVTLLWRLVRAPVMRWRWTLAGVAVMALWLPIRVRVESRVPALTPPESGRNTALDPNQWGGNATGMLALGPWNGPPREPARTSILTSELELEAEDWDVLQPQPEGEERDGAQISQVLSRLERGMDRCAARVDEALRLVRAGGPSALTVDLDARTVSMGHLRQVIGAYTAAALDAQLHGRYTTAARRADTALGLCSLVWLGSGTSGWDPIIILIIQRSLLHRLEEAGVGSRGGPQPLQTLATLELATPRWTRMRHWALSESTSVSSVVGTVLYNATGHRIGLPGTNRDLVISATLAARGAVVEHVRERLHQEAIRWVTCVERGGNPAAVRERLDEVRRQLNDENREPGPMALVAGVVSSLISNDGLGHFVSGLLHRTGRCSHSDWFKLWLDIRLSSLRLGWSMRHCRPVPRPWPVPAHTGAAERARWMAETLQPELNPADIRSFLD